MYTKFIRIVFLITVIFLSEKPSTAAITKKNNHLFLDGIPFVTSTSPEPSSKQPPLQCLKRITTQSGPLNFETSCTIPKAFQTKFKKTVEETCYWQATTSQLSLSQRELLNGTVFSMGLSNYCAQPKINTTVTLLSKPDQLSVTLTPSVLKIIPSGETCSFDMNISSCENVSPDVYTIKLRVGEASSSAVWTVELTVTESPTSPLTIDYLERNRGADEERTNIDRGVIAWMLRNPSGDGFYYFDAFNDRVTEQTVAGINATAFQKKGLTADGNTRLLIRVQSTNPGAIFFALDKNAAGFRLESLDGTILTEDPLHWWGYYTTPVRDGSVHQVTMVLVPPVGFQPDYSFPEHQFTIGIIQTDMEGNVYEESMTKKTLLLWNNPVILLHGLWGKNGTFGETMSQHIFSQDGASLCTPYSLLRHNLVRGSVSEYQYNGLEGPSEAMQPREASLYNEIRNAIMVYVNRGIACSQVDLLTHSMGGLIARKFIHDNYYNKRSRIGYQKGLVRRIITIATPHRGSGMANLITGEFTRYPHTPVGVWLRENSKNIAPIFADASKKIGNNYFLNPYRQTPPGNAIFNSAIMDLKEGSKILSVLDDAFPSVPIQGISGNAQISLRALLNEPSGTGKIGDWNIGLWTNALANVVQGNLREDIAQKPAQQSLAFSLIATLGDTMPSNARLFDILQLLDAIFPTKSSDLIVDNDSSKWRFGEGHTTYQGNCWADILNKSHSAITKQPDVALQILALLRGPVECFDARDISSLSESSRVALPVKDVYLRGTDGEKNTISDVPFQVDIEPVVDIHGIVLQLNKHDVFVDQTLELTGSVSQDVADLGIVVSVHLKSKYASISDLGYWLKIKADRSFRQLIQLPQPGLYEMYADVTDFHGRRVRYTSNRVEFLVRANVHDVASLAFYGRPVISQGEHIALDLEAVYGSGKALDVSSPTVGTQYRVADPSVLAVQEDGSVLGLKPGETTLFASFGGKGASQDIHVVATAREPDFITALSLHKPVAPVPVSPANGVSVVRGNTITLKVTPFDTTQGHVFYASSWVIKDIATDTEVALLPDGTAEYANWTPTRPGTYSWSMRYIYDNELGSTAPTAARSITVMN